MKHKRVNPYSMSTHQPTPYGQFNERVSRLCRGIFTNNIRVSAFLHGISAERTAKIETMYEQNKLTEVQRAAIAGYHKGNLMHSFKELMADVQI